MIVTNIKIPITYYNQKPKNKEHKKMKKLAITSIIGLALAIALGFGFIPAVEQTASCAECESDNSSGIRKAFEEFDVQCRVQINVSNDDERCLVPSVYNKIVPILKGLAADNRFGPGDRILLIGVPQTGNLLAGANRGFQSLAPLDKDSLTIELKKSARLTKTAIKSASAR